jgi:hypothetical protein
MRAGVVPIAVVATLLAGAATAQPAAGRYDGQLCVATRPGVEPSCGAADVDVPNARRLTVRVADIVYRLALRKDRLDVALMQGSMEIDEFSAAYRWSGDTLLFGDPEKDARYEIRVGARQRAARR